MWSYLIPGFILSSALLTLAIIPTLKQSLDMYKATKKWEPNRYMKLLVRDGILYFIVYVSYLFYHLHYKTDPSDKFPLLIGAYFTISWMRLYMDLGFLHPPY